MMGAASRNGKKSTHKKKIGIKWKLAAYLTVFAISILMVTFLFQVVLLGTFFRAIKKREIAATVAELKESVGTDSLTTVTENAARERSLGILIYHFSDSDEADTSVMEFGNAVPIPSDKLQEFYERTSESEEMSVFRIAFGGYEVEEKEFPGNLFSDPDRTENSVQPRSVHFLGTQIVTDASGSEYLLVVSASSQPLESTVHTLSTQYRWILGIVILLTVIMVILLDRRISKPLIRMTAAAKELAKGNYNTDFTGAGGFRETGELAESLNYAASELSKVDRLQKEFIANISHDLRTPLTMIKGYGEVIRDLPDENTPENIQVIIDEATRLSELVNDLLDLTKLQSGGIVPRCSEFDLSEAVSEVMQRYEVFTKHRGYTVSLVRSTSAAVFADRGMILQVIYNLINNAINYSGEDKTVTVCVESDGTQVRVSVSDTGEGIPQEEVSQIWERYYKVDKVHKRALVGTGLGLSIVRQILDAHGAAYGVQSTPGKGSTFWFALSRTDTNTTEE